MILFTLLKPWESQRNKFLVDLPWLNISVASLYHAKSLLVITEDFKKRFYHGYGSVPVLEVEDGNDMHRLLLCGEQNVALH